MFKEFVTQFLRKTSMGKNFIFLPVYFLEFGISFFRENGKAFGSKAKKDLNDPISSTEDIVG